MPGLCRALFDEKIVALSTKACSESMRGNPCRRSASWLRNLSGRRSMSSVGPSAWEGVKNDQGRRVEGPVAWAVRSARRWKPPTTAEVLARVDLGTLGSTRRL